MIRHSWLLLLGALPSCLVDSPVAERTRTAEQKIVDDADDWCLDTCTHLDECSVLGCECEASGTNGEVPVDDCECTTDANIAECVQACSDTMSGFSEHGQACAEAGLASMDCLDQADTCQELKDSECFREPKEVSACNGGKVACRDQSGGGDVPSVAPPGPESCEWDFSDCSDGATYEISCSGVTGAIDCDCFRFGEYETSFRLPSEICELPGETVNSGCGWSLLID